MTADALNRGPPSGGDENADLEGRLSSRPTRETDLMDFLSLAGWYTYSDDPSRVSSTQRARLVQDYTARRRSLPRPIKVTETRVTNRLILQYYFGESLKTVGSLRDYIEARGPTPLGIGYKGLQHFNTILGRHGLEPIRVGGTVYDHELRKYGLEPSRQARLLGVDFFL